MARHGTYHNVNPWFSGSNFAVWMHKMCQRFERVFESSGLTHRRLFSVCRVRTLFYWKLMVTRSQLEWNCSPNVADRSQVEERHKYEERCRFGRSLDASHIWHFVLICCIYQRAICGHSVSFFSVYILLVIISAIFLLLRQCMAKFMVKNKMHTSLIKRYGSVMRARSSLFIRKCIWLWSTVQQMEKYYDRNKLYKINRKIIISIGMPLVLEWVE